MYPYKNLYVSVQELVHFVNGADSQIRTDDKRVEASRLSHLAIPAKLLVGAEGFEPSTP